MLSLHSTSSPFKRAGSVRFGVAIAVTLSWLSGCVVPLPYGGREESTPAPATESRPETAETATIDPAAVEAEAVPEIVSRRYAQAVLLLETGDQTGAEVAYKRFSEDYPHYAGPYTNLAIIYQAQGRDEEAYAALQQALDLVPHSAAALNQIGILHRKSGRFSEAKAAYMKAVTADPDYALAHYNLGVLNDLYLGRPDQALSSYLSYQALVDPEDPQVAKWIIDLTRRVGAE